MTPAYVEKGNILVQSGQVEKGRDQRGQRAVEAKGLSSFRLGQAREGHRDTEHEVICT